MSTTVRSLTDVVVDIVDNRGRTCPTAQQGFPLIATNCIKPSSRYPTFENVRFVDEGTYRDWFRGHPVPGDIIFVCKGAPGRVAMTPDPVSFCIAQDMVALRPNPAYVDPEYLYYRLLAPDVQKAIENMHVGTLIPHFKKGDFPGLRFSVHDSRTEQRRIARALGALDDLIENNEQAIHIQRQLAVTLFARACQDERAGAVPFGNVAELVRDTVRPTALDPDLPYVGLEHFAEEGAGLREVGRAGDTESTKNRFHAGDVLYGKLRPYFRKVDRPDFEGVCSTEVWVMRPRGWATSAYLHYLAQDRAFTEWAMRGSGGTRMPRANWDHVCSMLVAVPDQEQLTELDAVAESLWQMTCSLRQENETLRNTRDELLPLLMSGRIAPGEVELSA